MRVMLDTNTVSYIARNRSASARKRLKDTQESSAVHVSVITEGEILFGLAKRPDAHQVAYFMHATLAGLRKLPWTSEVALVYGALRARNESLGMNVGSLDILIAAHASAVGAVLVTSDGAIGRLVGGPETVNWADDLRLN